MPRVVPLAWMPSCQMDRIITHWTAGGHRATQLDRGHYHVLIEEDGQLVRGLHPITDNVSTADGDYAAHTRGCNSRSIGVSVCCMANAHEPQSGKPLNLGPAPMTQKQYEVLAMVVADLCQRYGIPVSPTTVLGHGEVQHALGITQNGKWDPMVLPWDPGKDRAAVGDEFRKQVQDLLDGAPVRHDAESLQPVQVRINGVALAEDGTMHAGSSWYPLRPLAALRGWQILKVDADSAVLKTPSGSPVVKLIIRDARGYVQLRDLAEKLGWQLAWDPAQRVVSLKTP